MQFFCDNPKCHRHIPIPALSPGVSSLQFGVIQVEHNGSNSEVKSSKDKILVTEAVDLYAAGDKFTLQPIAVSSALYFQVIDGMKIEGRFCDACAHMGGLLPIEDEDSVFVPSPNPFKEFANDLTSQVAESIAKKSIEKIFKDLLHEKYGPVNHDSANTWYSEDGPIAQVEVQAFHKKAELMYEKHANKKKKKGLIGDYGFSTATGDFIDPKPKVEQVFIGDTLLEKFTPKIGKPFVPLPKKKPKYPLITSLDILISAPSKKENSNLLELLKKKGVDDLVSQKFNLLYDPPGYVEEKTPDLVVNAIGQEDIVKHLEANSEIIEKLIKEKLGKKPDE